MFGYAFDQVLEDSLHNLTQLKVLTFDEGHIQLSNNG